MGLMPELVSLNVTFFPEIVDLKLGVSSLGSTGSADSLATMAAFLIRVTQQLSGPYAVIFTSNVPGSFKVHPQLHLPFLHFAQ